MIVVYPGKSMHDYTGITPTITIGHKRVRIVARACDGAKIPEFARTKVVVPCMRAAAPPPAMIASVHFNSGERSVITAAETPMPAAIAVGVAIVSKGRNTRKPVAAARATPKATEKTLSKPNNALILVSMHHW